MTYIFSQLLYVFETSQNKSIKKSALVVPSREGNRMFLAASRTGEMLLVLNKNQNAHYISSVEIQSRTSKCFFTA